MPVSVNRSFAILTHFLKCLMKGTVIDRAMCLGWIAELASEIPKGILIGREAMIPNEDDPTVTCST